MPTNAAKVLVSRDLIFYYKNYHATNRLPLPTVPWGTAWATPPGQLGTPTSWSDGGFTQGGLGFNAEIARGDIRMDQSIDPVARPATGRTLTMSTNLGEFDLALIVTATGQGTVATQAPGVSAPGYDQWNMGNTVADNFYSAGFDINHSGDKYPVRVFGAYTQPTGAEAWNFGPEAAAVTPFNVTLFPRPSDNVVALIMDIIPPTG